jgi:hypothetical protein
MRAIAKGQMLVWYAIYSKAVWVFKHLFVAIARRIGQHQPIALFDGLPA